LQMELFENILRLAPSSALLRQQTAMADALTSSLAAQRKANTDSGRGPS
jgi:hypothetical protein